MKTTQPTVEVILSNAKSRPLVQFPRPSRFSDADPSTEREAGSPRGRSPPRNTKCIQWCVPRSLFQGPAASDAENHSWGLGSFAGLLRAGSGWTLIRGVPKCHPGPPGEKQHVGIRSQRASWPGFVSHGCSVSLGPRGGHFPNHCMHKPTDSLHSTRLSLRSLTCAVRTVLAGKSKCGP